MTSLPLIWLQFAVCAALIGAAGFQLSRYGDAIARRTGLSGSWINLGQLAVHMCNTYVLYLHGD